MKIISPDSLLSEILEYRAESQPQQVAYTFFQNGIKTKTQLTYQQLAIKAKTIASSLQSQLSVGDRVLLLYPQGLEFIEAFFGCLYAGVIAVPAPAPDTIHVKRYLPRLVSIVENCQAKLILTTTTIQTQLEKMQVGNDNLVTLPLLTTDAELEKTPENWIKPNLDLNQIAYLQYTSGSTSTPKGVMITHGNIINNLEGLNQTHYKCETPSIISWVPHVHDLGLVIGLLLPLYMGIPCYLLSPFSFIRHPILWLKIISDYKISYTHAPNFAYQYCVDNITAKQKESLDLSGWIHATIAAEPIRQETVEAFIDTFKPHGFNPSAFCLGYGLAEATLFCTATKQAEKPYFESVCAKALSENKIVKTSKSIDRISIAKCGFPTENTQIVIVNSITLTECSSNEVGEIWLAGGSVGKGYWQRKQETEETFKAYLADDRKQGGFLRTGDLGFVEEGELYVTGRLKDLIIIRGKNYYPQDIEWVVEKADEQIRTNSCAAFAIEVDGIEQLVIVAEIRSNKGINPDQIIQQIRQLIADEQELSVYAISLIKKGTIPKTSSGKIQRSACRKQFIDHTLKVIASDSLNQSSEVLSHLGDSYSKIAQGETRTNREIIAPRNEVEKMLLGIWKRVFKLKDSEQISVKDNFFALGGDSLKAVAFIKDVEATFSQEIPLSTLVEYSSIEKLAQLIQLPEWSNNHLQTQKTQSIVPLKPEGEKTPFFYIHPASGSVLPFANIARRFDSNRPLYGLQAVGIDGKQEPLTSIEAMASHYINQIKTIQPKGPYLIGGRCLGGITAFEMAQQLSTQGEKVNGLIMIEAPYQRKRMIGLLLKKNAGKLTKSDRDFEQVEQINNIGKIDPLLANHFDKLLKIHLKNAINYRPKMYDGQINYFYANEDAHRKSSSQELALGWDKFTTSAIKIQSIDGSHRTIDYEPNVQILANQLCNLLDQLES